MLDMQTRNVRIRVSLSHNFCLLTGLADFAIRDKGNLLKPVASCRWHSGGAEWLGGWL